MWQRFRSWPLWVQIAAWCLVGGILWLVWLWQKRSWPVWVRIGFAVAPLALWVTVGTLLSSPTPPAADAQAKAKKTKAGSRAAPAKKPMKRKSDAPADPKKTTTRKPKPHRAQPQLTGYGATTAAWNAHHVMDRSATPGTAYDPDPSVVRSGDERYDDRYYGVDSEEFVLDYYMRFPPSTGVEEAKQSVLTSEFPRDARIVWFRRLDTCAQMLVGSKTLARAASPFALVEFTSGLAGDTYNPQDVWDAILLPALSRKKRDALDC